MLAKIQIFSEIIARSHEKYTLFNEKDLPDAIRHFSTCLLSTVCNLAIIDCKIMGAHCLYNYDYYFFSAKLQKVIEYGRFSQKLKRAEHGTGPRFRIKLKFSCLLKESGTMREFKTTS